MVFWHALKVMHQWLEENPEGAAGYEQPTLLTHSERPCYHIPRR